MYYRIICSPNVFVFQNFERSPSYAAYTTPGFYGNREEIRSVVTYWSKEGNITAYLFYKNGTYVFVTGWGEGGYRINNSNNTVNVKIQKQVSYTRVVKYCIHCR